MSIGEIIDSSSEEIACGQIFFFFFIYLFIFFFFDILQSRCIE